LTPHGSSVRHSLCCPKRFTLRARAMSTQPCQIDVKNILRDFSRTKALGWKPKHNSKQTIIKTVRHLITELKSLLILISIFSHAWLPLLPELTNPLFTPNISMISSSKSLPRYSILKLYIAKWFWETGIPTDREPRSHRHNPKDNLTNSRPNTPNGEHKRTPRHNQRKSSTQPIKSPKPPFLFFPIF
jgi:hypothetical protein